MWDTLKGRQDISNAEREQHKARDLMKNRTVDFNVLRLQRQAVGKPTGPRTRK